MGLSGTGGTHTNLRPNYFEKLPMTVLLIFGDISLFYLPFIVMDIVLHG